MASVYSFYIGGFIVSIINPFWGLVILVFSVLIRFQDRFAEIAAIKPFSILLLGMAIGCFVHRDKLAWRPWKQDKLLLALLVVSIIGLLIQSRSDLLSETWAFLSALAFYFFATRILQQPRQFVILFAVMSCSIIFLAYEVIQDVLANPDTTPFIDRRNGRWQGLGYYQNANEFGQLMITTLPFLFAALLMKNSVLVKVIAITFITVFVFVVGKTGSRTVMVLLAVMFILTFVLRSHGNVIKKTLIAGSVGLVVLVGLSFAPGPVKERLATISDFGSDKSFEGRTRAWGYGFDMITWYPLTGVGKGQWIKYHGLMPHNSYVQIMAELGPLGIFLFLWIIYLSFKEFRPYFSESDPDPPQKILNEGRVHPVWGEPLDDDEQFERALPSVSSDTKSIVIAVAIVFVSWLMYIFLGNQGYAVWTYFYIGLCGAVRNLITVPLTSEAANIAHKSDMNQSGQSASSANNFFSH